MASSLILSYIIKAKFRRKSIEFTSRLIYYLTLFHVLCTVLSHSLLPPPNGGGSACGDVLCLHGTCQEGKCICDRGWQGSACHRCGGRIKLEGASGFITDGMTNYSTDLQCTWLIDSGKPEATIRLQFVEFETECSWDHLYIFDGDSVFSPMVAAYSGLLVKDGKVFQEVPEVVAKSGRAYLYFYSDAAYNMSGFNVSYSIDTCPKNCSSHGACIGGECTCNGGWDGLACDKAICPDDCNQGQCDKENRRCICDVGYAGLDCSQLEAEGYWTEVDTMSRIHGRALHQASVNGDSMWVSGGEFFRSPRENPEFLVRYDFRLKKWEPIRSVSHRTPRPRFAHSMAAHDGKLYMYGGILSNGTVTNELWMFDIAMSTWEQHFDSRALAHRQCLSEFCSPLSTMGHTATIVDKRLYIIFGHNPVYGYLNTVQEFNLNSKKWQIVQTRGALVKGGYGHTSIYDPFSKFIYVHGGYHSYGSDSVLVDLLYAYSPSSKLWRLLNPSHSPRYLHTAVIIHGAMLVFGGNGHNATHDNAGDKCFSPQFMMYEIECDSWKILKDPAISLKHNSETGRFGHTALMFDNAMYIFGGFNGLMLDSILKFTPGECSTLTNKLECQKRKPGVSCVWNEDKSLCQPFTAVKTSSFLSTQANSSTAIWAQEGKCGRRFSNFSDLCSRQTVCPSCLENSYGCVWCGDTCSYEKCKKSGIKALSDSFRCDDDALTSNCDKLHNCHSCHTEFHCGWQRDQKCYTFLREGINKTQKAVIHDDFRPTCDLPCHMRSSCENCTQGPCMWCSSLRRCIESNAYAAAFPIAQCMEWTIHQWKCPGLSCSEIQTCEKCQKNPRCGWCDDDTGTGVGTCMEGSAEQPYKWNGTNFNPVRSMCHQRNWHFTSCPECQCNGHSTCESETNVCLKPCKDLTEGSHCQHCMAAYYGNAINGGNCTPCFCHGHSVFCNRDSGKCHCTTKGIIGHHCERCDEQNHYFGNPTEEGGSCYYNLTIDFQYTFNMSKSDDRYFTRINFMNAPSKADVDVDFSISCSETALVNISIGSATLPIRMLQERVECGSFKIRFSHDEHLFGIENTTFYVNVFGFTTPFVLQISFSQHRTLDLLQFFVTFSSCFLTLLIIAAILWKIKQKYDMYRRRQQLFLELEHMASRPFAGLVVELEQEAAEDKASLSPQCNSARQTAPEPSVRNTGPALSLEKEPVSLKCNNPTPIALEPCSNGKAAVLTLIMRMPTGGTGQIPPGQTGLSVASALVSLGSVDRKSAKDADILTNTKSVSAAKCLSPSSASGL